MPRKEESRTRTIASIVMLLGLSCFAISQFVAPRSWQSAMLQLAAGLGCLVVAFLEIKAPRSRWTIVTVACLVVILLVGFFFFVQGILALSGM